MAVPNTFAAATSAIPLANLDANFAYYDAAYSITGTATSFTGAVTLSTGTANGVPYLNASKVLTSGSVLTFDGTILSSTRFAGALNGTVGATTANTGAFTTLTTSSTVTLNGGTANGVTYLNGSKVLTSGTALTFDGTYFTVGASSTTGDYKAFIQKAGGELLGLNASSGTLARIAFGNATASFGSTQIIANAADLAFITNSAEQMRLTSTGLGIGTSSPSQKLHVDSSANSSTWIKVSNGSNGAGAAAGVLFGNDGGDLGAVSLLSSGNSPANGLFLRTLSTNSLLLGTGNAVKATLDSAGNLGLGVTPSAWSAGRKVFESVAGAVFSENSDTFGFSQNCYNGASNWTYTTSAAAAMCRASAGAYQWFIAPSGTAGAAITFTQAMTLDASGRLLVGTTNVLSNSLTTFGNNTGATGKAWGIATLSNAGGITPPTDTGLSFGWNYSDAGGENNIVYGVSAGSSPALVFSSYNGTTVTERMRLDSAGNLGLGGGAISGWANSRVIQTDPTFSAISTDTASDGNFSLSWNAYATAADTWKYRNTGITANRYRIAQGSYQWFTAPSGTAGAAISFTQAMTLDASGNLLVGTTSTAVPNTYSASLVINDGVYAGYGGALVACHATGAPSGQHYGAFAYGGVKIGSITQNGTTGVLYNTSSDYRLKNITGPITTSGAYIDSLKPVEGTWKADGSTFVGLIAHETQEVSRTTVATGTKDGEQMQGMDYSSAEIIANLIAELQSVRTRLAALEAK